MSRQMLWSSAVLASAHHDAECIRHDHSSHGTESRGYRSRSRGQIPRKPPNYGGVNRRFLARKILILPFHSYNEIDSNQILLNDKDQQVLFAGSPNTRPMNQRWRTAGNLKIELLHVRRSRPTPNQLIWT